MPSIIRNLSEKREHPIYRGKCCDKCQSMGDKVRSKSPEKTESIPKTYDAIKTAAGASMKPKK
jgi:hypothetical protein